MTLRQLLKDLLRLQIIVAIALVVFMAINEITQYDALGFTGLWYELDLRIEFSFATWLESLMMLCCGLAAFLVFRSESSQSMSRLSRFFFGLAAMGMVFLAGDEMLGIHERIGEKMQQVTQVGVGTFMEGFGWVIFYAPIFLLGLVLLIITMVELGKRLSPDIKARTVVLLAIMAVGVVAILVLEVGEAYLYNMLGSRSSIMTLVEESSELVILLAFYHLLEILFVQFTTKEISERPQQP